ncbi:MAG: serine--tRNA ligase [Fimbriimonadaceae bacterium]|nr:serine--tRNA ligase [Chthonomonadaceae bacterium]MCO5295671.1 serine--tRNA ligase [Fimbriimonadaceae bacterium]
MLDRNLLRTHPDRAREGARLKKVDAPIDAFLKVDESWRALLAELQGDQAEMNQLSKSIGALMAQGKGEEAEQAKAQTGALKEKVRAGEQRQRALEEEMAALELRIPNIPDPGVPHGDGEEQNVVVRTWGEPAQPDVPKPHWEIAEDLGLLDLARGAKISGSGFIVYTGWGARLQRALIQYMIDHQTLRNGYREIFPPYLVNDQSLLGTGQLPKFEEDLYKAGDGLYLVPTAEVPVTNLYRDEILDGDDLTIKLAAYSACFRKEAGAAGKDTRGLLRVHQFDKVELVKFTKPEESKSELEALVQDAEQILQALGLHYRVAEMCTAELGFSNAKQYDLELWAPGVGKFLEISSCSDFEAFQARRANIRFRRAQGEKPEFVHTLNGSGLACPRLFAAILETFLQPDGSVLVPEPLRPYVGTDRITRS